MIGVREAARRLDVHENTVRNMVADGRLRPATKGRTFRFHEEEVSRVAAEAAAQSLDEARSGLHVARLRLELAMQRARDVLK